MTMPSANSVNSIGAAAPPPCRIAIVDGKPRLHGRLASLLNRQAHARGFISLDSLLERDDHSPLVIVVGPTMLTQDALEEFAWLMEHRPETALVLAAMHPTKDLVDWALETGVADIIDLASEADKLGEAVDVTARILSGEEIPEEEPEIAVVPDQMTHDGMQAELEDLDPMMGSMPVNYDEPAQIEEPMQSDDAMQMMSPPMAEYHPQSQAPPAMYQPVDTQEHSVFHETSSSSGRKAEIITVFSTKGGSGKSVVASNLAVKLAQQSNRPVVLLDADFQFGDLAVMMKLQPEHSLADAALFIDRFDREMLETMLVTHQASGVQLFASPSVPVVGDFIGAADMMQIIDVIADYAGHIVIDTQSHLDEATLAILRNSTEIVLVGSMDIPSVKDMKTGLHLLRSLNVPVEKARLVLNRANSKADLDAKQIERSLHHRVDAMVSSDQLIPQSINRRKPAVLDQPHSQFAKSIDALIGLLEKAH